MKKLLASLLIITTVSQAISFEYHEEQNPHTRKKDQLGFFVRDTLQSIYEF